MINIRKRENVYQYCFEAGKVNEKKKQIIFNQALLKLYQTSTTKDSLRNYQKVIKSSLRDATYYFGFIKNNQASDLQIPRVLSFDLKKRCRLHLY